MTSNVDEKRHCRTITSVRENFRKPKIEILQDEKIIIEGVA